ncbi:hypothetical protein TNCV_1079621 [Trichonephila clavipes]|nr:hypothetical protein TNCV_1079621 [Trichonephila clavipes]
MEQDNGWKTIVADLKMERDIFKNEFKSKENEWKSERDVLKSERDTFKAERDSFKAKRDSFKAKRDSFKAERNVLKTERDTFKDERDVLKSERDNLLLENCGLKRIVSLSSRGSSMVDEALGLLNHSFVTLLFTLVSFKSLLLIASPKEFVHPSASETFNPMRFFIACFHLRSLSRCQ